MLRRHACGLLVSAAARAATSAAPGPAHLRRLTAWTSSTELAKLQARVDGKTARVARIKGPDDDLLLLLVLDVTGDLTLVDAARQAACEAIGKLAKSAWVGVMRSQDGLRVLVDPTADREVVTSAIQSAPVSGHAGLLETVEPVSQLASRILRKTGVRVAVLYLTDSNIANYREDYTNPVINPSDTSDLSRRFPDALVREKTAKLADILAQTDAPIFIAHLVFLRDRLNEAYQTGLQQMAEATGGQALFCRTLGEVAPSVAQCFARIASMWAVDIELPGRAAKNMTVELSGEAADLQYRTRLVQSRRKE